MRVEPSEAVPDGVYAAYAEVEGRHYGAMASVWWKPRAGGGPERTLEVNILGYEGDLYGREITVCLLEYVREQRRFATLEALGAALGEDKEVITKILEKYVY